VLTDKTFLSDYRLSAILGQLRHAQYSAEVGPTTRFPSFNLAGRGDRSYFGRPAPCTSNGFFRLRRAGPDPVSCWPVIDHDYTVDEPILGGALAFHSNLTSSHPAIRQFRSDLDQGDQYRPVRASIPPTRSRSIRPTLRVLRGVPGTYTRFSTSVDWRRTFIDPYGRDVHAVLLRCAATSRRSRSPPAGCLQLHQHRHHRDRPRHADRRARVQISVHQRAVVGHPDDRAVAQVIFRPSEAQANALPNEDAQSLIFDDSNLFKIDKFSGWDRVEGRQPRQMPASSTPRSSTVAATSTCCSASPINCSG